MKEKQITHIITKLQKNANLVPRKCLYKDCNEVAINSHLLQKKGILSSISEQQHVYEISLNAYNVDFLSFKRTGIGEALSYIGFCNSHDTEIFKEIESGFLDYNNYKAQLLLSYRSLMIERRKKEINIDWYNQILNAKSLEPYLDRNFINNIKTSIKEEEQGIQDQEYYEKFFLSNIENESLRDFVFTCIELPRVEICSSSVFTYETSYEITLMNLLHRTKTMQPLTDIYFHLLPLVDKSVVILGCLNQSGGKCSEYTKLYERR